MANLEDTSFDDEDFDYSPNNRRLTRVISQEDADHEKELDSNSTISETNSMSSPNSPDIDDNLCTVIKGLSEDQIEEIVSRMKLSDEDSNSDQHTEEKDTNKEKTQGKGQKKKVMKDQPKKVVKENIKSIKQLNTEQEINEVESLPTAPTYPQNELPNSKKSKKGRKENSVADYECVPPKAKNNMVSTNIDEELTEEDNKQKKTKRTQRGKQKINEMSIEPKTEVQLSKNDDKHKMEDIENDSQRNVAVIKPQRSRMVLKKLPQENVDTIINPQESKLAAITDVKEKKEYAKKQNQKGDLKESSDAQEKSVNLLKKVTETAVEKKRNNIKKLTTEEVNCNIESKSTRTTRAKANTILREVNEAVDKNIANNINSEEPKKGRPKRNKEPQGHPKNMESEPDLEIGYEKPKKKMNSAKQKESEVPDESLSTLKAKENSKTNSVKAKKTVNEKENKDTNEEIVKKRVTRKK